MWLQKRLCFSLPWAPPWAFWGRIRWAEPCWSQKREVVPVCDVGWVLLTSLVRDFFCGFTLVVCLSNCVLRFFLDRMPLALFFSLSHNFGGGRFVQDIQIYMSVARRQVVPVERFPSQLVIFFSQAYMVFFWFWPAWHIFLTLSACCFSWFKMRHREFFLPFQESKAISLFGNCNPKVLNHSSFSLSHQPLRSVYFLTNVYVLKFWSVHCVFDDSLRILVAFLFWEEPTPLFLSVSSCLPCAKEHVHDTFACSQETN